MTLERLTEREREVIALLHLENKEIAVRLGISEWTVKNHVKNILRELNVDNRTQAYTWGRQARLRRHN